MFTALTISWARVSLGVAVFASTLAVSSAMQDLTAKEIVQRSAEVNQRDWDAASGYGYFERRRDGEKTKTYDITMVDGSRYARLVAVDDSPLSPQDEAKEKQRFEAEVSRRSQESAKERSDRIGQYQKERDQDRVMMQELTKAFDFYFSGERKLGHRAVYVLQGTPRGDYHPSSKQAKALTGMQGTLWIDKVNFHWVKAEAVVVRPVWIGGFVARVEPGTRFELEQAPTAEGFWMPIHFSMEAKAKVLFLLSHDEQNDHTYFGYHKSDPKLQVQTISK